jgi:hypothetical protein
MKVKQNDILSLLEVLFAKTGSVLAAKIEKKKKKKKKTF